MTKERKEEIIQYITYIMKDELKRLSKGMYYSRKDMPNEVGNQNRIQLYFDEEYKKVYMHYELDKIVQYNYGISECYYRINCRLNANFHNEQNWNIAITCPEGRFNADTKTYADQSLSIPINTFSYWKCFDGVYRFIQDEQKFISSYKAFEDLQIQDFETLGARNGFVDDLVILNWEYNFCKNNNEEVFKEAFEKYKSIILEYYKKELFQIDPKDISYIYLDAHYPELES